MDGRTTKFINQVSGMIKGKGPKTFRQVGMEKEIPSDI